MKRLCEKCKKELEEINFYTCKNGQKTDMCKRCLTMHIDAFNDTTYLWLLEKLDLPYVATEWETLRDRDYQRKGAAKFESSAVFGKYLSKMKLNPWNRYCWADGPKLAEEAEAKRAEAAARAAETDKFYKEKYEKGEIAEAEYKTLVSAPTQRKAALSGPAPNPYLGPDNPFNEKNFIREEDLPSAATSLTQEDKVYLAMKWGRLYTPDEWIALERNYTEMTNSFDIQDADTANTLILICKTDLKMNQAIDNSDIEGYQKLSKVSESLRKSAKFTAAQNKEEKGDFVDSIGELVNMCEKEGFIPRFATDIPQDKVDQTLKDQKDYIYNLITQDLGFGQQIEDALKKIEIQRQLEEEERQKIASLGEDYDPFYDAPTVSDEAYVEMSELTEEQLEQDELAMQGEIKEGVS